MFPELLYLLAHNRIEHLLLQQSVLCLDFALLTENQRLRRRRIRMLPKTLPHTSYRYVTYLLADTVATLQRQTWITQKRQATQATELGLELLEGFVQFVCYELHRFTLVL